MHSRVVISVVVELAAKRLVRRNQCEGRPAHGSGEGCGCGYRRRCVEMGAAIRVDGSAIVRKSACGRRPKVGEEAWLEVRRGSGSGRGCGVRSGRCKGARGSLCGTTNGG